MSLAPDAQAVLDYWFGGTAEDRMARWWKKNPATDEDIRARFGDLIDRAAAGAFDSWTDTPRGALALVIILDQFTRTIFRGSPKGWACDAKAREVVADALASGRDGHLDSGERLFLYMPLMHSERLPDQELAVQVFEKLGVDDPSRAGNADYARQHRDIVLRFGRFPHRNAVLGRESTPEEVEFLKQPGSSF